MAGLTFRESCHRCPYAESRRAADITVADFWGVGRLKEINPAQGVSLTLLNTSKGEELFTRVRPYLMAEERCVTEAVTGNGQLQAPFPRPLCKDDFTDCYLREGLQPAVRRFARQWDIPLQIAAAQGASSSDGSVSAWSFMGLPQAEAEMKRWNF